MGDNDSSDSSDSSAPTENQYDARSTLVLTMLDASSFATLAKKLKSEISNFSPATKAFSYTFIGIVAFTLLLQALIAFLLLMSYRFEIRKEYTTTLVLNDWIIVGILLVILLNSIILSFEDDSSGEETSFFRGNYSESKSSRMIFHFGAMKKLKE